MSTEWDLPFEDTCLKIAGVSCLPMSGTARMRGRHVLSVKLDNDDRTDFADLDWHAARDSLEFVLLHALAEQIESDYVDRIEEEYEARCSRTAAREWDADLRVGEPA